MSIDEAQLARYGELVARLARPLADRSAVLWLARIDENGFARLEAACLESMQKSEAAGAAFAKSYARMHALLEGERPVDAGAATVAAPGAAARPGAPAHARGPSTRVEGAQLVDTGTISMDAPTRLEDTKAAPPPPDAFTLASATNAITPRPAKNADRGDPGDDA